jgi:hypothetical protein
MKTLTDILHEIPSHSFSKGRAQLGSVDRPQHRRMCLAARHADVRAYLRDLRAAEMMAWELTGGDYLIGKCISRRTQLNS